MSEHWCLINLRCLPNAIPSVQVCVLDVPAASDGKETRKRRKEEINKEEEERTWMPNEY